MDTMKRYPIRIQWKDILDGYKGKDKGKLGLV